MRNIDTISFVITTKCNRSCPDCCCNISKVKPSNFDFDESYIALSLSSLYIYNTDIKRIHLTGGEPTLHQNFSELVKLFNSFKSSGLEKLTLETNLWNVEKFKDDFKYFDEIYVSHYTERTYKGCKPNTKQIEELFQLELTGTKIYIGDVRHKHFSSERGKICARGESETISYFNGKLYPCCVAWGIEDSEGIDISYDFLNEIKEVRLPCINCRFSEGGI